MNIIKKPALLLMTFVLLGCKAKPVEIVEINTDGYEKGRFLKSTDAVKYYKYGEEYPVGHEFVFYKNGSLKRVCNHKCRHEWYGDWRCDSHCEEYAPL